jgi:hypothetical protein
MKIRVLTGCRSVHMGLQYVQSVIIYKIEPFM